MIKQYILIPPLDHVCTGLLSYLLSISCETIWCLSSFLSEKWNISNPVNKSQVDATAVVRQELFDPCVIKWIIKYVSHKKLYLAVTVVSKFHPHTIRKWTYKVAKFTDTISLGSCIIINLVDEVLCPNPVQGLSNAPFTRQICKHPTRGD